ncbi:TRAP transporter small permease [Salipiger abyssi]|uniref:TRAP transporter small permease n=1 Tax=Salipiger abyssi TaxID=1250539 RepID=UPI00405906C0
MIPARLKSSVSRVLLYAAGACFLFGTGVTVLDVAMRAIAGANVPAAIELTSLSIGLGALLSMPVCYTKRSHVTAKLLSEMAPQRFRRPLGGLGALISVGFAAVLLFLMAENTLSKLGSPETTSDLGLPMPIALGIVSLSLLAALVGAVIGLVAELSPSAGERS